MRMPIVCAVLAVLALLTAGAPPAGAATTCVLGGPAPGFSAVRVALPTGSALHALRLTVAPPSVLAGSRSSWHVAAGVGVIDAATGKLVTARVINIGSSPRRVVVTVDGDTMVHEDAPAPDALFEHQGGTPVPSLPAGDYYIVGFGNDGDAAQPTAGWAAELALDRAVTCERTGEGELFEADHTDFDGGTQVSAYGFGLVDDATHTMRTDRRIVFGLMDAATQLTPTSETSRMGAELRYDIPAGASGTVRERIVPFVGSAGEYRFSARATGGFPLVLVSGVALTIPEDVS